nr:class I SAM-dependent methyltransferase [Pyrococcus sp. ST04]
MPLDKFFEKLREKAIRYIQPGSRVLEVGIGTGKTLKYYPKNIELYAVDGSIKMLEIAKKKAESLGINVNFFHADVENLPFPDNVFDYVVSSFVFCTVPNPERGMLEIKRVLKPGGRAIFLEHTLSDSKAINNLLLRPLEFLLKPLLDDETTRKTHELVRKFFEVEKEEKHYKGVVRLIIGRKPHSWPSRPY